jgi:hypothetical protein
LPFSGKYASLDEMKADEYRVCQSRAARVHADSELTQEHHAMKGAAPAVAKRSASV